MHLPQERNRGVPSSMVSCQFGIVPGDATQGVKGLELTRRSESCEMWQHGQCVNQHTQPRVYICAFCANTPNMRGGRLRDTGRANGLDIGVGSSPLASKSFRSLR